MAKNNVLDDEEETVNESKKDIKARKKEEKKLKKTGKNVENNDETEDSADDKGSSRFVVVITTFFIVLLWIGIISALIKFDVGGFGSGVLQPILKDVPYVNKILPSSIQTSDSTEQASSPYATMEEALAEIDKLQSELSSAKDQNSQDSSTISDLQSEVARLQTFEQEQSDFETLKAQFYDEVVNGDNALDITEYQKYYESIDPENAAALYKQVVQQTSYDDKVTEYASTYSSMKPADAAAILNTMTDNLDLVAEILGAMDTQSRGNILGAMDTTVAANVTKLMAPSE